MIKSIRFSKTVWFNIITGLVALLALPELIHVLPASVLPWDALLMSAGNLVLRIFFTSQPISQFAAFLPPQN